MATRVFKLITGEEIIGQAHPNVDSIDVTRVRTISRLPLQGPAGVQFINVLAAYLGGSPTDNLRLKPEHILIECDPAPDLEAAYMKDTSGIELATAMPRGRS